MADKIDTEKIIDMIRRQPAIYDYNHEKYRDPEYKANIWRHIAKRFNVEAVTCKTRWNNIRDNFRKTLKKRVTENGQPTGKIQRYRYESQLGFLLPFIQERDAKNLVDTFQQNYDSINETTEFVDDIYEEKGDVKHFPNISVDPISNTSDQNMDDNVLVFNDGSSISSYLLESPKKQSDSKESKANNLEPVSASLIKYLLERSDKANERSVHPVDAWLSGLAPTLKSLNPYYLNVAKTKIFNVLQKVELDQIMGESSGHIASTEVPERSTQSTPTGDEVENMNCSEQEC